LQQPYSIAAATGKIVDFLSNAEFLLSTDDKATIVRLLNELEAQFKTGLLYYMEEDDVNRGQQISPGQDLIQPKVERINSQLAATHAQRERLVKNAKTFRSRVV